MNRRTLRGLVGVLALAALSSLAAVAWPPGTSEASVGSGWSQPVGLAFAADGRMFVWEKGGRVWNVENGVKAAQPLIDLHEEVGNWRDYGMLGFALDPGFYANGYVYLLYVVDYHHLKFFGTPSYDPNADWYFHDTIARLVRYTCNSSDGFHSVDPLSRRVLIGESMTSGIPICHQSHGIGSLVFGEDGTLLVSCGDGASYETVDVGGPTSGSSNTALADGILRPKEDVGAYRAQLVDCLDGKVLRVDPVTGDGLPSNPFFDAAAPRAPRSRVWALGLRNPFRMTLLPGTGAASPSAGDPGTLAIGDVGWNAWEELEVCDAPGLNFGWPVFEGMDVQPGYAAASPQNLDAPNPLFGFNGCGLAFLPFASLIVQDTLAPPSWPNPCNASSQIPATLNRFEHVRPILDWGHGGGPARTKTYSGTSAATANVGAPGSPVSGPQFGGNCGVACTWFPGAALGPGFQDTLIFGDYVASWLNAVRLDASAMPTAVMQLGGLGDANAVVAATYDAVTDALYFIEYDDFGGARVQRLLTAPDLPPTAVASLAPAYGPTPLGVQFTGSASSDPEGAPLAYAWDFGDGQSSTQADPFHVYGAVEDVTAQGAILAKVFTLVPPHPLGGGSQDPEVMRDGDFPPAGSGDDGRQYDTFHNGDQGADDWVGYDFGAPREFRSVVFQEGKHFADGGWFDSLGVFVWNGATWNPVPSPVITPAYPGGNATSYETFQISFAPISGSAIVLYGDPGGSANFISVGELRVLATAPGAGQPTQRDVHLVVSDPAGHTDQRDLIVSLDNTPPVIQITSPVDGSLYTLAQNTQVPLTAVVSDAEHGPAELACSWRTILHHDEHTHPEPPDAQCATSATITPIGCDGHTYFYEFELTVTDAAGLASTASVFMYPDCCGVPPTVYCTPKTNSLGCVPQIQSSGVPHADQPSGFVLSCTNVRNAKAGLLLYGVAGRLAAPFSGGTLCVHAPIKRTPTQSSGGTPLPANDCSGVWALDFSAYAHGLLGGTPLPELQLPGTLVDVQWWGRDPGFAPPGNTALSAGIEFVMCD